MKKLIFIFMQCLLTAGIAFSQNNWEGIGNFNKYVERLYPNLASDKLYIGGTFSIINADTMIGVTNFDGDIFNRMSCGMDWNCDTPVNLAGGTLAIIKDFVEYNGELYITGGFQYSNNKTLNGIAKWNGADWDSIGSGLKTSTFSIGYGTSLKIIDNELYVVGKFDSCVGIACNSAAKFDGTTWSSVNNLPRFNPGSINFLSDIEKYNGDLYVTGNFYDPANMGGDLWRIARFDGNAWVPVKNGIKGGFAGINHLLVANNLLYLCGTFTLAMNPTNPGNGVAAYDGTNWIDLGGGVQGYSSMPQVRDMKFYDNKLYVCGSIAKAGGVKVDNLAYWDGINWFSLDTNGTFDNVLNSINFFQDTLYVGGGFWTVNGDSITSVAKWLGGDYFEAFGNTTGINDRTIESAISIFPNPVNEKLFFKGLPKSCSISIYNSMGQLQQTYLYTSNYGIDISNFRQGIYFYTVLDAQNSIIHSGKFVKQ